MQYFFEKTSRTIGVAVLAMCILSACENTQKTEPTAQTIDNTAAGENDVVTRRSAADACPRLIQKRVDTTQSVRQESISASSCDYFIYPKVGDQISVVVSNSSLKPTLRMPVFHDFANGIYTVTDNGRHVIRVEYDAIATRPNVLDFEIEVDIKPAS